MKFKFLGTPECPEEIMVRDVVFPVGEYVEVEDGEFARKLSRLPYFADDVEDAEVIEPPKRRGRKPKVQDAEDGE